MASRKKIKPKARKVTVVMTVSCEIRAVTEDCEEEINAVTRQLEAIPGVSVGCVEHVEDEG